MSDLLRYRKDLKYILFDCETEGLNLAGFTRPWQISWILVEEGRITKEFDLFPFIHDLKVSPDAARVTGFNYEEYKRKSRPALEVYEEFWSYYSDKSLGCSGQNIFYDWAMIKSLEKYLGLDKSYDFSDRMIDTMALSKAYKLGIQPPNRNKKIDDYIAWQFSLIGFHKKNLKTSVATMLKELEIEHNPLLLHNGLWDVKYTNELFKQLIWKVEI